MNTNHRSKLAVRSFALAISLYLTGAELARADVPSPCATKKDEETRKECHATPAEGTIGKGPNFEAAKSRMMRFFGGFVEGNTLYIAHGDRNPTTTEVVALYAVDLTTGNRRVISGSYVKNPQASYSDQTLTTVGAGPPLQHLGTVRRFGAGKILARGYSGFLQIDEATGARVKLPALSPDCGKNFSSFWELTQDAKKALVLFDVPSKDTAGVTLLDLQTMKCTPVATGGTPAVGKGVPFDFKTRPQAVVRSADDPSKVYVNHFAQSGVWSVDLATGERTVIARRSGPLKKGDMDCYPQGAASASKGRLWYATDDGPGCNGSALMYTETGTGNQVILSPKFGPQPVKTMGIWPLPGKPNWVVYSDIGRPGIAAFDLNTKSAVWVSR